MFFVCLFFFVGERREGDHQKREVAETMKERRNVAAMALAGERKLRGVEVMIEMNDRRSDLADQEQMGTETMVEGERDKNGGDRTVTMKEGRIERGNAMRGERKKSLVGERIEGGRGEKLPMEEERRGETEIETAPRKEAERKEEEIGTKRGTEKGIEIEIEIGTGGENNYPVCKKKPDTLSHHLA